MSRYQSNLTLEQADRLLREASSVWVFTHAKPDGDAWGSVVAMSRSLQSLGKAVHAWLTPPVPAQLLALPGSERVRVWSDAASGPCAPDAGGEPGLVLVLDTGSWSQLGPARALVEPRLDRTLIIDHHLMGDADARWKIIDPQAAACCEMLEPLAERLASPVAMPRVVADALFVGLASDTGWFRFSNSRPRTHEMAARLLAAGVDHAELYRRTEQMERPQKLRLLIRALDSLELLADGRVAYMQLRAGDFAATGASMDETERFVDVPQTVDSVELVILATESIGQAVGAAGTGVPGVEGAARVSGGDPGVPGVPGLPGVSGDGMVRLSFRSKPGDGAVNVAEVAARFGGGGHARAAGAKVRGDWAEVVGRAKAAAVAAVMAAGGDGGGGR